MRIFLELVFLSGEHNSASLGVYRLRKFTSPRKECIVSLSGGNCIFRIDSVFFGSGEIPVEFHL